ncbi:MAG: succinate dehydrogenase, cytochrome b556 subunit [Candidatus Dormibacteraeota bacterium]|nr:succinate dehydrogenase, cytochrome b556 subunit [Candidatus Dormibacteraeota bacterium]
MFRYRISWSQLAWLGHRLSGIGVLVYLFMHIVENATLAFGPGVYNTTQTYFRNLPVRLGEIVLMAALVYHSLNGLRVVAMDFWPATTRWYRPVTYAVIIGTIVAMIPLGLIMITPYAPWNGR